MKSIGNGTSTSIWADRWIIDDVPQRPINIKLIIDLNLKVFSLITTHGECDLQLLNEFFPPCYVMRFRSFPPEINL